MGSWDPRFLKVLHFVRCSNRFYPIQLPRSTHEKCTLEQVYCNITLPPSSTIVYLRNLKSVKSEWKNPVLVVNPQIVRWICFEKSRFNGFFNGLVWGFFWLQRPIFHGKDRFLQIFPEIHWWQLASGAPRWCPGPEGQWNRKGTHCDTNGWIRKEPKKGPGL